MAMHFGTVLDRISKSIEQQGHRWLMAGGLAMQAHGFSRTTRDPDLIVDAAARAGLLAFMESLGCTAVDRARVRRYFESAGMLDRFDELLRLL